MTNVMKIDSKYIMTHMQFRWTKAPMNCWPFSNVFHSSNISTTLPVYVDHCPAMDMKKLKKRVNLKNCEFQKGE